MSVITQQKVPPEQVKAACSKQQEDGIQQMEATENPQELVSRRLAKEEPVPQKARKMSSANRKRLVITI
jgi:hypothetical protein